MENYSQRAIQLAPDMVRYRRIIHENPEVGGDLPQTTAYVMDQLVQMGYTPEMVGGGITCTVGNPGKVFLLRADMDALPMTEESGLPFASRIPGAAHCCGHDLHTAMLLGAAKMLKENEEQLEGTVKFMFQPGEEPLVGARSMIDGGILENPKVDAAMAVHVNSMVPAGAVIVFHGPTAASSDFFTIKVKGKGCHGGRPNEGIDPISILCHIHTALQELQARELAAGDIGVMTVGMICGGSAANVIPDTAEMRGTIRTFDSDIQKRIKERAREISENVAKAFRGEAEVEFAPAYAIPMVCDEKVAAQVRDGLDSIMRPGQLQYLAKHFPGSEDFSFIANMVPSSFVVIGAAVGQNVKYGQHHPKVQFNEMCLPIGAAVYAQAATEWLRSNK